MLIARDPHSDRRRDKLKIYEDAKISYTGMKHIILLVKLDQSRYDRMEAYLVFALWVNSIYSDDGL